MMVKIPKSFRGHSSFKCHFGICECEYCKTECSNCKEYHEGLKKQGDES